MYNELPKQTEKAILSDRKTGALNPYGFFGVAKRRIDNPHDYPNAIRSDFIRDTDKIMNCPYFARYQDKTQVFSLVKNDDISRRSLHVQLVSRIARTLGKALNLNVELIEAIALGHDIGHTPFGHTGERFLDELYREKKGRRFFHNVHSVRVLDKIFPLNLSLQTLDGILTHNGEIELAEYKPVSLNNFEELDEKIEKCYSENGFVTTLMPSTLEGCVVRVSDIIAYLGKDRHDATLTGIVGDKDFSDSGIGVINSEIINNISVNVIENSYGKPYIKMDDKLFSSIKQAKKENYEKIYLGDKVKKDTENTLKLMMAEMYEKLLIDLKNKDYSSFIYKHHIEYLSKPYYKRQVPYIETEPNQIVVDFIASMTDDYFIDLYSHLFPDSPLKINYKGYFE